MKTERELFEEWCHIDDEFCTHRYTDNCQEYSDDYTQSAWLAWQARVPEGYVVVPKEPTDKTIVHMTNTPIEVNLLCDHADTFLSEGEACIAYQAMIEAVEK